MEVNIAESWKNILQTEFEKPYFKDLMRFVNSEYDSYACFPDKKDIFAAFDACSFNDLKVVIIGQDPYHGIGQANGLCFSVQEGVKHPPSLVNIFKELETDLAILTPISGDLSRWATQGVLLLNASLLMLLLNRFLNKKKRLFFYFGADLHKRKDQKLMQISMLF
jgi:uracil-DNA glycosylase